MIRNRQSTDDRSRETSKTLADEIQAAIERLRDSSSEAAKRNAGELSNREDGWIHVSPNPERSILNPVAFTNGSGTHLESRADTGPKAGFEVERSADDRQSTGRESVSDPEEMYDDILDETGRVLVGNEEVLELLTIALLTRGHVLLEGVPGVAKTTIANLFARASGLDSRRIQMTPDVLPADITGTRVYREHTGAFELQRGPIFTNLVVADEINRATPKTQSALLEAMQERHVTIEGNTLVLPEPFMVVATQNPIEMEGVFELPEAQRDRFRFKLTVDLPDRVDERELLERFDDEPQLGPDDIERVVDADSLLEARHVVADVHVASPVKEYVLDLVGATRDHPDVTHGGSPRASLALLDGTKGRAAIHGRSYVIPDDVKAIAEPTLVHRLVLRPDANLSSVTAADIVTELLEEIDPPGVDGPDLAPPNTDDEDGEEIDEN